MHRESKLALATSLATVRSKASRQRQPQLQCFSGQPHEHDIGNPVLPSLQSTSSSSASSTTPKLDCHSLQATLSLLKGFSFGCLGRRRGKAVVASADIETCAASQDESVSPHLHLLTLPDAIEQQSASTPFSTIQR